MSCKTARLLACPGSETTSPGDSSSTRPSNSFEPPSGHLYLSLHDRVHPTYADEHPSRAQHLLRPSSRASPIGPRGVSAGVRAGAPSYACTVICRREDGRPCRSRWRPPASFPASLRIPHDCSQPGPSPSPSSCSKIPGKCQPMMAIVIKTLKKTSPSKPPNCFHLGAGTR